MTVSEPTQIESEELPDAIPVYTIFGAKGLQAPIVFFVAVTRASEHLVISAPLYLRGSTLEHTVGTRAGEVIGEIDGALVEISDEHGRTVELLTVP